MPHPWSDLERLTVGAKIVTIFRNRGDEGIVIITDREHPDYPGELLSIHVYVEDGQVEVATPAAYSKQVV